MAINKLALKVDRFLSFSHPFLRRLWWASIIVMVVAIVVLIGPYVAPDASVGLAALLHFSPRRHGYFNPLAYFMIGQFVVVVFLILPVWFSARFRSVAWITARVSGLIYRWLTTDWRRPLGFMGVVIIALYARIRLLDYYMRNASDYRGIDFLLGEYALKGVAAAAVLIILYFAYKARTRIVITPFEDCTGDEHLKEYAKGISSRLLNELARLYNLYTIIDDARPTKISEGEIINAAVAAENVTQDLERAVGTDSQLSLGFINIPIGSLMGLFGRVVQGPRLTGSLHKEGDTPILIAHLSGGRLRGNWRVSINKLDPCMTSRVNEALENARKNADDKASAKAVARVMGEAIDLMAMQLACRVFTDLANIGSPRWRAVASYTEGLRIYRDTLLTKGDKTVKLRNAEKSFFAALSEDNKFAYNHYNLGVVYRDLGQREAARAAFLKAIKQAPGFCKAYYALACTEWDEKHYDQVKRLCEQSINIRPDEPLVWNLFGLAQREIIKARRKSMEPDLVQRRLEPNSIRRAAARREWKPVVSSCETATALAWRNLCLAAIKGHTDAELTNLKEVARTCTANLAAAYVLAEKARPEAIFEQALKMSVIDSDSYCEWGRAHETAGAYDQAIAAFTKAKEIANRPLFWAFLAYAHSRLCKESDPMSQKQEAHRKEAEIACRWAINMYWGRDHHTLNKVKEAWEQINQVRVNQELAEEDPILDYLDLIKNRPRQSDVGYIKRLEKKVNALRKKRGTASYSGNDERACNDEWACDLFSVELAKQYLDADPQVARQLPGQPDARQLAGVAEEYLSEVVRKGEMKQTPDYGYSQMIQRQSIYSYLAVAALRQDKPDVALYPAERGVALNPERCWERSVLGGVYWALNNYERAEAQWDTALKLDPITYTLNKIASVYWSQGQAMRDRAGRRKAFGRVIEILNHALLISESQSYNADQLKERVEICGQGHYWLGWYYYQLMKYDSALGHMRIVQALKFRPLESKVMLGLFHTKAKAYNEAEEYFRAVIGELERLCLSVKNINEPAPGEVGEEKSIIELLINAYHYRVFSCAERRVKPTEAKEWASRAERYIEKMDETKRPHFLAINHLCQGWLLLEEGAVEEAIKRLTQAVALEADANSYYRLALAYYKCFEVGLSYTEFQASVKGSTISIPSAPTSGILDASTPGPKEAAARPHNLIPDLHLNILIVSKEPPLALKPVNVIGDGAALPPGSTAPGSPPSDGAAWLLLAQHCCRCASEADLVGELDKEIDDLLKKIDGKLNSKPQQILTMVSPYAQSEAAKSNGGGASV